MAREEHLGLQADEAAGHVQVVRRLVQPQMVNRLKELVGNPRDGDVGDLELLLPDQVEQKVERAGEALQLDHEGVQQPRAGPVEQVSRRGHDSGWFRAWRKLVTGFRMAGRVVNAPGR
jgi:hypothetical protein